MNGAELVAARVSELIVMGGEYPSGWEFNFGGLDPESTVYVLEHWPTSVAISFSGVELGRSIYSGHMLAQHSPSDSIVLAAYQWYVGRCSTVRESWDPITMLYGVLGLDGFAKLGIEAPFTFANDFGYNKIVDRVDASNAWANNSSVTNQHWLRLADGVSNASVAWLLDRIYVHDPLTPDCSNMHTILLDQS